VGTAERYAFVPLHPLRGFFEGYPMNEDEDKPTPADGQLVWVVVAFIVLMLGLLTLKSCYG
jgi:hypothetical protein